MIPPVAALPMYDWPEARSDVDALWAGLRTRFLAAGIEAPETLARRNGDLPAVPGGIRDAEGRVIAPDPATLPPDELNFPTLWKHPCLLLAQTCWGPLEQGLDEHVVLVGQPRYDGIEGGYGELYSSAILMRRPAARVASPGNGRAILPLDLLRNSRLAFNSADSMSGILALTRDLEALGESLATFGERIETGSHRASVVAVAQGRADVCAIDCKSWQLAERHEPAAADLQVVGWTARRKGLPFITSRHTSPEVVDRLRSVLSGQ